MKKAAPPRLAENLNALADLYGALGSTAKGFGVGLALANSIIEAHESALCVDSAPGKGSLFSFLLPLWTAPAGAADGAAQL